MSLLSASDDGKHYAIETKKKLPVRVLRWDAGFSFARDSWVLAYPRKRKAVTRGEAMLAASQLGYEWPAEDCAEKE